jgi:hypothetical protein
MLGDLEARRISDYAATRFLVDRFSPRYDLKGLDIRLKELEEGIVQRSYEGDKGASCLLLEMANQLEELNNHLPGVPYTTDITRFRETANGTK